MTWDKQFIRTRGYKYMIIKFDMLRILLHRFLFKKKDALCVI